MDYEVLCSDVSNHQQGYLKGTVKTFKFDPEAAWHRHEGQEFLFVLKGILELHTEFYNPLTLNQGDSILFDSSMGHHYVSLGDESAEILITMSLEGYQNISDTLFTFKTKNPKK
jgi:quercetin dioxygenase-like cupin family protein